MMPKVFLDDAWEQFHYWTRENRTIAEKIYNLLQDIERNGVSKGIGKPERLKHKDCWSRRITEEHRLTYNIKDGFLYIFSCKGHYDE